MTRRALHILLDVAVFSMAAFGSLMAFGFGASWAVLRSALSRRNPIEVARPSAARARSALSFLYAHSGLPGLFARLERSLRARK